MFLLTKLYNMFAHSLHTCIHSEMAVLAGTSSTDEYFVVNGEQ